MMMMMIMIMIIIIIIIRPKCRSRMNGIVIAFCCFRVKMSACRLAAVSETCVRLPRSLQYSTALIH